MKGYIVNIQTLSWGPNGGKLVAVLAADNVDDIFFFLFFSLFRCIKSSDCFNGQRRLMLESQSYLVLLIDFVDCS